MKIAIVEDEQNHMDSLIAILHKWEKLNYSLSITPFSNGEDLIKKFNKGEQYDMIFMDIGLDGEDGMSIAKALRNLKYDNGIAFVTNHRDYSCEGYDVSALYYLIKPITYEHIDKCIEKLDINKHFFYTFNRETKKIPYNQILYLEIKNHNILVHLNSVLKPISFRGQFTSEFMEKLPNHFVQCHRSYIVNIKRIEMIKNKVIYFNDDKTIKIGNAYLKKVFEIYNQF